ncbi:unnamed protein product [Camellia sinensis]
MAFGSISMTKSMNLTLAMLLMIVGMMNSGGVWAEVGCLDDVEALDQCMEYFNNRDPESPPSQACCVAVRAADIPCVCQFATPKALDVVSVAKVAFVARACGRPLPHGFKCGRSRPRGNRLAAWLDAIHKKGPITKAPMKLNYTSQAAEGSNRSTEGGLKENTSTSSQDSTLGQVCEDELLSPSGHHRRWFDNSISFNGLTLP